MTPSIIRISILLTLAAIGIAGLATIPTGNLSSSIVLFIFSKATAAVCFYYIFQLYRRWSRSDKWIGAYHRWCGRGLQDCYDYSLDTSTKLCTEVDDK